MKKLTFIIVALAIACTTTTASAQSKITPDMFAAIFPGNPVKIKLPPKGQFVLAAPLTDALAGMVGSSAGQPAGLFLTEKDQQDEIYKKIEEAASENKVVILFGVQIDPLNYWTQKQYRAVKDQLTKAGFNELQNYRWLSLSSYLIMTKDEYKEWQKANVGSPKGK